MKAFALLGSLIATAVGAIYMWKATARVVPDSASGAAENLPAMAADVTEQANANVAAMEQAMKESE